MKIRRPTGLVPVALAEKIEVRKAVFESGTVTARSSGASSSCGAGLIARFAWLNPGASAYRSLLRVSERLE